jgi:hypothetical protein
MHRLRIGLPEIVLGVIAVSRLERWSRLSEQIFRIDKWSLCRGQAAKRSGSGVK